MKNFVSFGGQALDDAEQAYRDHDCGNNEADDYDHICFVLKDNLSALSYYDTNSQIYNGTYDNDPYR